MNAGHCWIGIHLQYLAHSPKSDKDHFIKIYFFSTSIGQIVEDVFIFNIEIWIASTIVTK